MMQAFKRAFEVLLEKPIMLWGLSLMLVIVSAIGAVVTASIPFLSIAVGYLFSCGAAKLYLDGLKGKKVNSKQLFAAFNRNCVRTAGAMAWRDLWTFIWSMVPIIGTVKAYSYRFVPYILVSRPEISAFDALKVSMKLTDGKKLQMWLADLVYFAVLGVALAVLVPLCFVPILGIFSLFVLIHLILAFFLFGAIFTGLYQAAFFNEDEIDSALPAPEAEAVAE